MTCGDALLSLAIGVAGSLIASQLFLNWTRRREIETASRKFSGPEGTYTGYGYVQAGTQLAIDKPISEATIQYIGENALTIELAELPSKGSRWVGRISMENEQYGVVSWNYVSLHGRPVDPKEHRFGFKRLMYLQREGGKVVYLVGEEGYGKEILLECTKT